MFTPYRYGNVAAMGARTSFVGTGTLHQSDDSLFGTGTAFLTQLHIGDRVTATDVDCHVVSVNDDATTNVDTNIPDPTPESAYIVYHQ